MRSTFKILFYLKKDNVKVTGYVPLMARITINGVSAPSGIKAEARPGDRDSKSGHVRGRTKKAGVLNSFLDDVRSRIRSHYLDLSDRQSVVSAAMVKDAFLGLNTHGDTVLSPVDRHNANLKTLVGKQIVFGTYHQYVNIRNRLHLFLRRRKNAEDISHGIDALFAQHPYSPCTQYIVMR